jgi:hypothetical protein
MNFFIKIINKLFNKNRVKYLSAPLYEANNNTNISPNYKEKTNYFKVNLAIMANPNINEGNGYGILKIEKLEDMV